MADKTRRKTPLAAHLIRAVSVEAPADPRTVIKVLRGQPVSPLARERVVRILGARGLLHLVRTLDSSADVLGSNGERSQYRSGS